MKRPVLHAHPFSAVVSSQRTSSGVAERAEARHGACSRKGKLIGSGDSRASWESVLPIRKDSDDSGRTGALARIGRVLRRRMGARKRSPGDCPAKRTDSRPGLRHSGANQAGRTISALRHMGLGPRHRAHRAFRRRRTCQRPREPASGSHCRGPLRDGSPGRSRLGQGGSGASPCEGWRLRATSFGGCFRMGRFAGTGTMATLSWSTRRQRGWAAQSWTLPPKSRCSNGCIKAPSGCGWLKWRPPSGSGRWISPAASSRGRKPGRRSNVCRMPTSGGTWTKCGRSCIRTTAGCWPAGRIGRSPRGSRIQSNFASCPSLESSGGAAARRRFSSWTESRRG